MATNLLTKMMGSVLQSSAKSLLSGGIKKGVKTLIKQQFQKSPQDIEKEITATLGYLTTHYKLDKDQNIIYRPSSVFMHEWLCNSPKVAGRIVRDEEDGNVYVDGILLTNQVKVELIHLFIKDTNAQSSALSSHFDSALKLFDVSDFNAIKFKKFFAGWDTNKASVIDTWMEKCFGTALDTDAAYARLLFRKWIVGSAARAITPGKSLDGCLVLRGTNGLGKTQFFRQLLSPPFDHRTGEVYCDVKNPQRFVEALLGKTVACFDELSILEHANTIETFKQLLTTQFIDVRLAWARSVRRFNIRVGLSGTTNKEHFITDKSLNRRLWIIELNDSQRLDFNYLNEHKKELWQEAVYLAEHNESCILSLEEQKVVEAYNEKFAVVN